MLSVPQYVALCAIMFAALGAVWYVADRRFGVPVYRRWYALTHAHPLPAGDKRGFVYNRTTKARLAAATVVSTVQSLLVLISGEVNLLVELVMWLIEIPVTMIGFYLGRPLYGLWSRKDDLLEAVDRFEERVESAEIDVAASLRSATDRVAEEVRDLAGDLMGDRRDEREDDSPAEPAPPAGAPPEEPDPRERMRRYRERRQDRGDEDDGA